MARSYLEFPVQPVLADRVVCTWIDRRNGLHPVLPDACIDLVWDGEQLGVAGPDTRAWDVDATKTYVCIRFRPGAAPGVLGVPASELVDQDIALADIWGAASEGARRPACGGRTRGCAADHASGAGAYLADASPVDAVVGAVLRQALSANLSNAAVVQRIAARTGLSPRSLHRRCMVAFGYGPKTLDRRAIWRPRDRSS